ncbi:MAG: metal ABC transporter permease [Planctomycetes bacterium]|nr:metal ABC transporter permease [Planctomycetota bacterium]
MIEDLQNAIELIREFFLDGFLALLAVAVVGPILGSALVVRRMPLLALAVPQLAACGQAAAFCWFALFYALRQGGVVEEPGPAVQLLGSVASVFAGMLLLMLGSSRTLGARAAIAFLFAVALRDVLFLATPYDKVFEDLVHRGRLLTVDTSGRNTVLAASVVVALVFLVTLRRNQVAAFDPDQARLLGAKPRVHTLATMLLFGLYCAVVVPIVDATVVLVLTLVPPIALRTAVPTLASYVPWCITTSLVGAMIAFVLACTEGIDWPPGPTLTIVVTAISLTFAIVAKCMRRH